jgi:hypothetical protein
MNVQSTSEPSPSLLARKILCSAYVPAPFNQEDRFRFQALHAIAMIRVIARHIRSGYRLTDIERRGKGYIVDLLFQAISSGIKRLDEVKSSRTIREVHRIQAALYATLHLHTIVDEIAVSNREKDEILSSEFIDDVRRRAEITREFLENNVEAAASRYTPHEDVCYTCANEACPFLVRDEAFLLRNRSVVAESFETEATRRARVL